MSSFDRKPEDPFFRVFSCATHSQTIFAGGEQGATQQYLERGSGGQGGCLAAFDHGTGGLPEFPAQFAGGAGQIGLKQQESPEIAAGNGRYFAPGFRAQKERRQGLRSRLVSSLNSLVHAAGT